MALVKYTEPLTCEGCALLSTQCPWAAHASDASGQIVASGPACLECFSTMVIAMHPQKITWHEFRSQLQEPEKKRKFLEWKARRLGKPAPFQQSSVSSSTTAKVDWVDTHIPLTAQDINSMYSTESCAHSGLRWTDVKDGCGMIRRVVLVKTKSRVNITYSTEISKVDLKLRASQHVRPQQGSETWQALLEGLAADRPAIANAMSPSEIDKLLGAEVLTRAKNSLPVVNRASGAQVKRDLVEDMFREGLDDMSFSSESTGAHTASGSSGRDIGSFASHMDFTPLSSGSCQAALAPSMPPKRLSSPAPSWDNLDQQTSPLMQTPPGATDVSPAAPPPGQRPVARPVEPPEQKENQTQSKGRRRAGAGPSNTGKKRKLEGNDAELTVENVLAGLVQDAKSKLYHRRMRLRSLAKTASQLDIYTEEREIEILAAAIQLGPDDLRAADDATVQESITHVLTKLSGPQWPREAVIGLVRRAGLRASNTAAEFLDVCWPLAGEEFEFRPANPRLGDLIKCMGLAEKIEIMADMLIKDFVAANMKNKWEGSAALVSMSTELSSKVQSGRTTTGVSLQPLVECVCGVSAMMQTSAVSPQQFAAFEQVDSGKNNHAEVLTTFLEDPWWQKRRSTLWEYAAHESATQPLLHRICEAAKCSGADMDEHWTIVRARWEQWSSNMRPGALEQVAGALSTRLQADMQAFQREADSLVLENLELSSAATLRDQAERIRQRVDLVKRIHPQGEADLRSHTNALEQAAQKVDASDRMSKGNRMLANIVDSLSRGEDIPLHTFQSLNEEYEGCVGFSPSGDTVAQINQVVQHLCGFASEALKSEHCRLAGCLLEFLDHVTPPVSALSKESTDSVPHTVSVPTRLQWRKTCEGLHLQELMARADLTGEQRLAQIAEAVQCYERCADEAEVIASVRDSITSSVKHAREALAEQERTAWNSHLGAARQCLSVLQKCAGGKDGGSWKEGLTADSRWQDVEREAQYHLFQGKKAMEMIIHAAHQDLTKVLDSMQAQSVRVEALTGRALELDANFQEAQAASVKMAKITQMEIKFLKALEKSPKQRQEIVKERVASMGRHGLSPDDIQPLLWHKVKEAVQAG